MKRLIPVLTAAIILSGCALKKKEGFQIVDHSNDPDLVCERVPVPGKVYPGKICMTAAQWERHNRAGQTATSDVQRGALRTPAPGQGT